MRLLLATFWPSIRRGAAAIALGSALVGGGLKTARAEEQAGFVLEVVGTWHIEGATPREIAGGDKLPAGATIAPRPLDRKPRIVVCLFTGEAETYTARTTLPKRVEPSLVSRVWRAMSGHYRGGIVHAVSRGEDLSDGVLRLADGKLDAAPLLEGLPEGTYLLQFAARAEESARQRAPLALSIEWKPPAKSPASAATLRSGLYRVQRLNKRTRQPTGAEALALVSGVGQYETNLKTFDEAKALTERWDEQVRKVAGAAALRACLESLAEPRAE